MLELVENEKIKREYGMILNKGSKSTAKPYFRVLDIQHLC